MRTIRNTFRTVAVCAAGATAAACGGSPEPTSRGEISRAEVLAEAESAPLTIDTPELRRLSIESAWRFDTDTLEIECWGDGPDQSFYYTARPPGGQRSGPAPAFSDGTFRVPGQGAFGYAAELSDVLQDDRLGGRLHTAARRICGGG